MKRSTCIRLGAATVFVLLLAYFLTGCVSFSENPRTQYAQLNDVFIATVDVLVTARNIGEFDQDEWGSQILPLINIGHAVLEQLDAASKAGQPTESFILDLQEILILLNTFVERVED